MHGALSYSYYAKHASKLFPEKRALLLTTANFFFHISVLQYV